MTCETRTKRSVEVCRGKNLQPLPPTNRDRRNYGNGTDCDRHSVKREI
jgi:hypothetical protein